MIPNGAVKESVRVTQLQGINAFLTGIGCLVGVFVLFNSLNEIDWLEDYFPLFVLFVFFGLVLGIVYVSVCFSVAKARFKKGYFAPTPSTFEYYALWFRNPIHVFIRTLPAYLWVPIAFLFGMLFLVVFLSIFFKSSIAFSATFLILAFLGLIMTFFGGGMVILPLLKITTVDT